MREFNQPLELKREKKKNKKKQNGREGRRQEGGRCF